MRDNDFQFNLSDLATECENGKIGMPYRVSKNLRNRKRNIQVPQNTKDPAKEAPIRWRVTLGLQLHSESRKKSSPETGG